jgi:hypothetical protein
VLAVFGGSTVKPVTASVVMDSETHEPRTVDEAVKAEYRDIGPGFLSDIEIVSAHDFEQFREAVRDALVSFPDTAWARAYWHLIEPEFVAATPQGGRDCPSCGRAEVSWYCPRCGWQGDPAPTIRDVNGHEWDCPAYNAKTFTTCTCGALDVSR